MPSPTADRYGSDVLQTDWRAPTNGRAVPAAAELGAVVEEVMTDFVGETVAVDRDLDAPRLEGPHDVVGDARGQHGHAVGLARHLQLHGDGEVEVGAGDPQRVAGELGPHTGEHRKGPASAGHGAPGSAERLDEDITFATKLHDPRSPCRCSLWWIR